MSSITPALPLFLVLGPILVIGVGLCLFRALWQFLGVGVSAVWQGLGPWQVGRSDQRIPVVGAGEPAHLGYWWLFLGSV